MPRAPAGRSRRGVGTGATRSRRCGPPDRRRRAPPRSRTTEVRAGRGSLERGPLASSDRPPAWSRPPSRNHPPPRRRRVDRPDPTRARDRTAVPRSPRGRSRGRGRMPRRGMAGNPARWLSTSRMRISALPCRSKPGTWSAMESSSDSAPCSSSLWITIAVIALAAENRLTGVSVCIGTASSARNRFPGTLPRAWPMARSNTTSPWVANAHLDAGMHPGAVDRLDPLPDRGGDRVVAHLDTVGGDGLQIGRDMDPAALPDHPCDRSGLCIRSPDPGP